jgi:putative copper resistance protein D
LADCCSPTFLFVAIRTVHFIACLLLLAVWAFDRLVLPAAVAHGPRAFLERWERQEKFWTLVLLPLIAISGIAWFMQLCVNMSGLSLREAMGPDTLRVVWNETNFGRLWQVRSILWLGMTVALAIVIWIPRFFRSFAVWIMTLIAAALAASLAWAGHGQDGGTWHLLADAIHLFTAGVWPMGLAPFALILFQLRKISAAARRPIIAALTFRFSAVSMAAVALLMASGVINGLYMVGGVGGLVGTGYGRVLIVKSALFIAMLAIAAVNLIRLKPRLARVETADASAGMMRWNVMGELSLGLIVVVLTAALGLMTPGRG